MILFGAWLLVELLILVLLWSTFRVSQSEGRPPMITLWKNPLLGFAWVAALFIGLFAFKFAVQYEVSNTIMELAQQSGFVTTK